MGFAVEEVEGMNRHSVKVKSIKMFKKWPYGFWRVGLGLGAGEAHIGKACIVRAYFLVIPNRSTSLAKC